ncbi:hypothetical protein CYMTET_4756 [Cymbomonas tetramitiformis]|uniref:VWFA domain-containing protein n=1 Tax=Cymbomonas tetramitiformis TaxID=36881 RepID=A0AAE0LJT7_9CHLO|nr:hypothetical protein CYMTET_4756 [Cymbomonas tetramitiformis]|eukprot:gene6649-7961_t
MHTEVVSGINSFIREQAAGHGEATVTILQFDTVIESVVENCNIRNVPTFNNTDHFVPRNQTALLDGIGATIEKLSAQISRSGDIRAQDAASRAACCVITTDGLENASSKYSRQQIFTLINQKKLEGWTFIFMGANQDAIQAGAGFGISAGHCLTYSPTGAGYQSAFDSCSKKVAEQRACGFATPFSPSERASAL